MRYLRKWRGLAWANTDSAKTSDKLTIFNQSVLTRRKQMKIWITKQYAKALTPKYKMTMGGKLWPVVHGGKSYWLGHIDNQGFYLKYDDSPYGK
jgi:hypothetical protein